MASKTDICNGALSVIGEPSITDFDTDTSEEGDQCRINYEVQKQALLTRLPWRFAQKTVALVADATAANPLFSASFALPADFLQMGNTDLDNSGIPYFIEGVKLITSASSVTMNYTVNIQNEDLFTSGFRRSFEYLLASRMAYALTKDKVLSRDTLRAYELIFEEEANRDAIGAARNQTYILDDFLRPRRGGRSTPWGDTAGNT